MVKKSSKFFFIFIFFNLKASKNGHHEVLDLIFKSRHFNSDKNTFDIVIGEPENNRRYEPIVSVNNKYGTDECNALMIGIFFLCS